MAVYRVENDMCFLRCYVAFVGALEGFKKGCRPFIGLDGTFLKSQFKGQLFTTVAFDGNNQLFSLAMAYVEKKKRKS